MSPKKLVAVYGNQEALLSAIRSVRERGASIFDAFTPEPVPGMDEALGLRPARMPAIGFGVGFAGMVAALSFRVSSSPDAGYQALLPLTIQSTLALALAGAVLTFLAWRRLSAAEVPALVTAHLARGRYVLVLDHPGRDFESDRAVLASTGPVAVDVVG